MSYSSNGSYYSAHQPPAAPYPASYDQRRPSASSGRQRHHTDVLPSFSSLRIDRDPVKSGRAYFDEDGSPVDPASSFDDDIRGLGHPATGSSPSSSASSMAALAASGYGLAAYPSNHPHPNYSPMPIVPKRKQSQGADSAYYSHSGPQRYHTQPHSPPHFSSSPPASSSGFDGYENFSPPNTFQLQFAGQGKAQPPQRPTPHKSASTGSGNATTSPSLPAVHRSGSITSSFSAQYRPSTDRSHSVTSQEISTMPRRRVEDLTDLAIDDIPRWYVLAAPTTPTNVPPTSLPPFRIVAPCQALCIRDGKYHPVHGPSTHPGYAMQDSEAFAKSHANTLLHLARMTMVLSSTFDAQASKTLVANAERVIKLVKPTGRTPIKDDLTDTGVESSSLQIEQGMVNRLQLDGLAKLMRDMTGSTRASDWTGGLLKVKFPATGRTMWLCPDCAGRSNLKDQQASLNDVMEQPEKSAVKAEVRLFDSSSLSIFTHMFKGQGKVRHMVIHLSPEYFEQQERRSASIFSFNQNLFKSFTNTIREAQLTALEINGNQIGLGSSEDKDNIYLHLRQLFACVSLDYIKLSGLPFLLREKLSWNLRAAKHFVFDGILLDTDKAITNMKKLINENSDMVNLTLTGARMTGPGLKALCSAHKQLRRLTRLDLSRNNIDEEGIKALTSQVLPTSLDLQHLDLSDNPEIGARGSVTLAYKIWPPPHHETTQKMLKSFKMANTGFSDEAAMSISKAIDIGSNTVLSTVDLGRNGLTKTGLGRILSALGKRSTSCAVCRVVLSEETDARSIPRCPGFMEAEVLHMTRNNLTLTHLTLSKLSLGVLPELMMQCSPTLIALTIENVICVSHDSHYALKSFDSLCQGLKHNMTLQDLRIRSPWSLWTLAFPLRVHDDGVWNVAAGSMSVLESSLQGNTTLRCFQMNGVTNFGEDLPSRHAGDRTRGETIMFELSQSVRAMLERNQVFYYSQKYGLEAWI